MLHYVVVMLICNDEPITIKLCGLSMDPVTERMFTLTQYFRIPVEKIMYIMCFVRMHIQCSYVIAFSTVLVA